MNANVMNIKVKGARCSEWRHPKTYFGRFITVWLFLFLSIPAWAVDFTNDQIADAIYKAEGGAKTSHPYGILTHYKHTTPRAACINTIIHARKDWNGRGDFISFLGSRYCPVGCDNDNGTNKYWIKNVYYFLGR